MDIEGADSGETDMQQSSRWFRPKVMDDVHEFGFWAC